MELLNKINELFDTGKDYDSYLMETDSVTRTEHLKYFDKMKIDTEEIEDLTRISKVFKILVFCQHECHDCRIVLAVMAQLKSVLKDFNFKIVPRSGNENIMQKIHTDQKIPLVVEFNSNQYKLIFNEVPETLTHIQDVHNGKSENDLRLAFREGEFKREIIEQILQNLIQH